MKITATVACVVVLISAFAMSWMSAASVSCETAASLAILPNISEASGVALGSGSPTRLWVINDSDLPVVYGVDLEGRTISRVMVAGARVYDWEDLATGPCPEGRCLFIADIGDNAGHRPRIAVYRIPEPSPGATTSAAAQVFFGTYPDGAHNAESIFVDDDGRIFLITKGRFADVYRFPASVASNSLSTLEKVGRLTLPEDAPAAKKAHLNPELVTGAALSVDRRWVAIRSNQSAWFFRANDFVAGKPGEPIHVDLAAAREPQGEGITFGPDGTIYLIGEGGAKGRPGTLRQMTCALPR